jgi:hypothetical protein
MRYGRYMCAPLFGHLIPETTSLLLLQLRHCSGLVFFGNTLNL